VSIHAESLDLARGGRTIVRGIDLTVARGEVLAVLGPNGAGKSTLLAGLAGLLEPAAGRVRREGRVATALQTPALARRSALANVELALRWWSAPQQQRRARALAALHAFGVGKLADRAARTLSGGEARRVHLARVLAVDPDVLLLDEPFAGLDPAARADLLYDARDLLRSPQRATIVVLHDRAEAWALADRCALLIDGAIAAHGTTADVFDRPPTARAATFLGYAGELREPAGRRLVRPAQVTLDPTGPLEATIERVVPTEDGARLELTLPSGRLVAHSDSIAHAPGERLRLRVDGGIAFDDEAPPAL
jgi:ABC-type sulfate/molybdate transport systems ATPase subunit